MVVKPLKFTCRHRAWMGPSCSTKKNESHSAHKPESYTQTPQKKGETRDESRSLSRGLRRHLALGFHCLVPSLADGGLTLGTRLFFGVLSLLGARNRRAFSPHSVAREGSSSQLESVGIYKD
ncbi:hypothetical protein K1719_019354 [Acacia pycnantha]|nr:hypothetical protein K1719_019354 [Acacia pycnantha]